MVTQSAALNSLFEGDRSFIDSVISGMGGKLRPYNALFIHVRTLLLVTYI